MFVCCHIILGRLAEAVCHITVSAGWIIIKKNVDLLNVSVFTVEELSTTIAEIEQKNIYKKYGPVYIVFITVLQYLAINISECSSLITDNLILKGLYTKQDAWYVHLMQCTHIIQHWLIQNWMFGDCHVPFEIYKFIC